MDYDNPTKELHRNLSVTPGRTYRRIIDLCGPQMLSQKHLVRNHHVNCNSDVTIIEGNKVHAATISRRWRTSGLWKKPLIHIGDVSTCNVSGKYDWVNLDTCSSFSLPLANWISNIQFEKNGELNVWLTPYRANMTFLRSLHKTYSIMSEMPSSLIETGDDGEHPFLDFIDRSDREDVLSTASGIAQSLTRYDYRVWPVRTYIHHRSRMFLYRFTDIRPTSKSKKSLSEILMLASKINIKYDSNKVSGVVGEFTKITKLLITVAKGASSYWPYTASRMKTTIRENEMIGKTPIMTKAGWKAHISKIEPDAEIRKKCHSLIERV